MKSLLANNVGICSASILLILGYAVPPITACLLRLPVQYIKNEVGHFTFGRPTGSDGAGEFPLTILDYPDSAIGQVSLPEVIDGDPVRAINGAFENCRWVTRFSLPQSLESIAGPAFEGCHRLTQITIPRNVVEISSGAFANCSRLEAIEVDPANPAFVSVDGVLFSADLTRLIQYPGGRTGDYEIPSGVTYIESDAFRDAGHLTGIVMPVGVDSIGSSAFADCHALEEIVFPESLISIEVSAFAGCRALQTIDLPESLQTIGRSAFANCDLQFSSLVLPHSVTEIGSYAFENWKSLEEVMMSKHVWGFGDEEDNSCQRGLGGSPFAGCLSLRSFTVDKGNENFEDIEGILFSSGLSRLVQYPAGRVDATYVVPDHVKGIGSFAFVDCRGLTSISISKNVVWIAQSSFAGCTGLASILVDEDNASYRSIDGVLYSDEGELQLRKYPAARTGDYVIPGNVSRLEASAFVNCAALTHVAIPAGVQEISSSAFVHCKALTAISVDPSNKRFSSLEGVLFNRQKDVLFRYPSGRSGAYRIPEEVTQIGSGAFAGSDALTEIVISEGVEEIGWLAFEDCTALTRVALPRSLRSLGGGAFSGCSRLVGVRFAKGDIEDIGTKAFGDCPNLLSVYFGGHAPQQISLDVFSGIATDFSITYGRQSTGFSSPEWRGYPASEAPLEAMPLKVETIPEGVHIHWALGDAESYEVYHSENLKDWTLITESPASSAGALAIFEDTDPSRRGLSNGYYRVEPRS